MSSASSNRPWLIVGHYGGNNTGDEAMLLGLILGCPLELRQRLVVVTRDGTLPYAISTLGVMSIPAALKPVWRALQDCDGIIWGGGTHFHDDYLPLRYIRHMRYLLRYLILFTWLKLRGRKVIWLGMGFGPIWRAPTKLLLRWGLLMCDHVCVRDILSAHELRSYIAPDRLTLAFDLAGLLPPPSRTASLPETCTTIGLSVVGTNATQTGKQSQSSNFWQTFTKALLNVYRQHPHLRINVFVIRGGTREDDQAVSRTIVEALALVDATRVTLTAYQEDPTKTFQLIAGCEGFIATRFHAAILSYLAGCRLLFLAYHRKLTDLAQEIQLDPEACLDISRSFTVSELESALHQLIEGKPVNKPKLAPNAAMRRSRRNMDILSSIIEIDK